jgi:photosystem II stability/assembly factor-like uncharacterized protein
MAKKYFLLILFVYITFNSKAQEIVLLQQGKPTSIRGLSVVNDHIAWISGSNGYIAITRDGGKNWAWKQVKGFEKAEFRSIEAFSDKEAIIMASGTPALILKTTNGGKNWHVKYRNTDTSYFLDAMNFTDRKHGVILGDPIRNKFLLLETNNYGETWQVINAPEAISGEAAFAASGTCLRITTNTIDIASGGKAARHLYSKSPYQIWRSDNLLIAHGRQSQGAFSMSCDKRVFVGGDYTNDKDTTDAACWRIAKNAHTWQTSTGLSGYQSCVELIKEHTYLSIGTSGSNISTNGGKVWVKINDGSFNVCRKARHGNLVLLAGNKGRIAIFKL